MSMHDFCPNCHASYKFGYTETTDACEKCGYPTDKFILETRTVTIEEDDKGRLIRQTTVREFDWLDSDPAPAESEAA